MEIEKYYSIKINLVQKNMKNKNLRNHDVNFSNLSEEIVENELSNMKSTLGASGLLGVPMSRRIF